MAKKQVNTSSKSVDKKPMTRILLVHPLDIAYSSYQYIAAFINALRVHDIEVALLAPHQPEAKLAGGGTPSFKIINMVFENKLLSRATKREINQFDPDLVHAWNPREMVARAALETVVGTGARLIVNYEDPEHFHFDTLMGPTNSSRILRHVDKPFVTAQDLEAFVQELNWHALLKDWKTNPHSGQFLNPVVFALLNHMAVGFTGIWHPWVRLLTSRFRKPVLHLPYAVDFTTKPLAKPKGKSTLRARLEIPDHATVFLRSGMIYAIVNDQETLFAGFAHYLAQRPDGFLVLSGKDGDPALTRRLIDRYQLGNHVRVTGFLNEGDYQDLLDTADVFLCPGYPDDYNRYRLAMKIIEYMILGKPMICYASGIGEDLVHGRDAMLLTEYTPERVGALMVELADNPTLRATLGTNARARAENWFDVHATAARAAEFYRTCLSDPLQKPIDASPFPFDAESLPRALLTVLPDLVQQGVKRVALYGAGKHTTRLLNLTRLAPLELTCIVDDHRHGNALCGIPVIAPEALLKQPVDALIISSDTGQDAMTRQAQTWLPPHIRLVQLY